MEFWKWIGCDKLLLEGHSLEYIIQWSKRRTSLCFYVYVQNETEKEKQKIQFYNYKWNCFNLYIIYVYWEILRIIQFICLHLLVISCHENRNWVMQILKIIYFSFTCILFKLISRKISIKNSLSNNIRVYGSLHVSQ